jgi:hypothetical protein
MPGWDGTARGACARRAGGGRQAQAPPRGASAAPPRAPLLAAPARRAPHQGTFEVHRGPARAAAAARHPRARRGPGAVGAGGLSRGAQAPRAAAGAPGWRRTGGRRGLLAPALRAQARVAVGEGRRTPLAGWVCEKRALQPGRGAGGASRKGMLGGRGWSGEKSKCARVLVCWGQEADARGHEPARAPAGWPGAGVAACCGPPGPGCYIHS